MAEFVNAGPTKVQICSSWLPDRDEMKITMKMSSFLKTRIIDHELCVCEYGFRTTYSGYRLLTYSPALQILFNSSRHWYINYTFSQLWFTLFKARFVWLKVVSTNRSVFKGEAPRFSADFVHPLSSQRPFKFPRHLKRALEISWIIAMSDKNIRSAIFNWQGHINRNWHGNGHGHGNIHRHGHGHRHTHGYGQGHGHVVGILSLDYLWHSTVQVPTAL